MEAIRVRIKAVRYAKQLEESDVEKEQGGVEDEEGDVEEEQGHVEEEESDVEEEEDDTFEYEVDEAIWRAMDYLHTTMFTNDTDAVEWFREHQNIISWDDGGDNVVRELLDGLLFQEGSSQVSPFLSPQRFG
jgi:hypothetical protein